MPLAAIINIANNYRKNASVRLSKEILNRRNWQRRRGGSRAHKGGTKGRYYYSIEFVLVCALVERQKMSGAEKHSIDTPTIYNHKISQIPVESSWCAEFTRISGRKKQETRNEARVSVSERLGGVEFIWKRLQQG